MAKSSHIVSSRHNTNDRGNVTKYATGYVLSLILTLATYILVTTNNDHHARYSATFIILSVMGLALLQFAVQLKFFIHLGDASKRWSKLVFASMVIVVIILVGGSLWIMDNLHYNMMSPQETETYMQTKEGIL